MHMTHRQLKSSKKLFLMGVCLNTLQPIFINEAYSFIYLVKFSMGYCFRRDLRMASFSRRVLA